MHCLEQYKNLGVVDVKSPPSLEREPAEPVYKQPSKVETNISLIETVVEPPSEETTHK